MDEIQEKIYHEAKEKTEQLVENVLEELEEFADEKHYEYSWVLGEFRRAFIRKTRKVLEER